jgi:1-phosphofructokinase
LIEAACELAERGVKYVVVSLGERGALGVTRLQSEAHSSQAAASAGAYEGWRAAPLRVPVASTVGAGDALVAGLVASLAEKRPWHEVGRRATAFAAGKLARVGPHLPDRATLDALAAQVELRTFSVAANPLRVTQHQAV